MENEILVGCTTNLESWNVNSGERVRTFDMLSEERKIGPKKFFTNNFTMFVDNDRIVSGVNVTTEKMAYLVEYELSTNKIIKEAAVGRGSIMNIRYYVQHPKNLIISSSWLPFQRCCVFSHPNYEKLLEIIHKSSVNCSEFVPHRNVIFTASQDGELRQTSLETGKIISTKKDENNYDSLSCVEFSKEKGLIFCSGQEHLYSFKENEFPKESMKVSVGGEEGLEGSDLFSFRVLEDSNLLSVSGYEMYGIFDLRKMSRAVFRGTNDLAEVWRQQLIGEGRICYGLRKSCEVRDWKTWKLKASWNTTHTYTDCLAYQGDRRGRGLSVLERQAQEDCDERIKYIFENVEEYKSIQVQIGLSSFHVLFILL